MNSQPSVPLATSLVALFVLTIPVIATAANSGETSDVEATVHQSTVDKILNSIDYPYTAFDGPVSSDWKCLTRSQTARLSHRDTSLAARPFAGKIFSGWRLSARPLTISLVQ